MNLASRLRNCFHGVVDSFRKPVEEYIPITLEKIEKEYAQVTKTLREKLNFPKTPENLRDVYYLQRELRGNIDFAYKFSDFYTAERVELIWDLLHEAKSYIGKHPVYGEMAKWRCETFADSFIAMEKAREELLKLYEVSTGDYKNRLADILN